MFYVRIQGSRKHGPYVEGMRLAGVNKMKGTESIGISWIVQVSVKVRSTGHRGKCRVIRHKWFTITTLASFEKSNSMIFGYTRWEIREVRSQSVLTWEEGLQTCGVNVGEFFLNVDGVFKREGIPRL